MAISSATKSLAEDIEASYATRIAGISDIVQETHQNLDNFKRERQEKTDALKNELSSSERDRTQEFATFIGSIKDEVATLEQDTNQMLSDFRHDLQEKTDALRSELSSAERDRRQEFATFQRNLSSAERDRRQEFATFQRNLREQLASTVADITADHRQARAQWESLRKARTAKQARH